MSFHDFVVFTLVIQVGCWALHRPRLDTPLRRALSAAWALLVLGFILRLHGVLALKGPHALLTDPWVRLGDRIQWMLLVVLLARLGALAIRLPARLLGRDPALLRVQGALMALAGLLALLGWREAHGPVRVREAAVTVPGLPAGFEGTRILLMADLHAGPLTPPSDLAAWRAAAEAQHADLVVWAGDYVDTQPEELETLLEAFRGFSAPLGVYAVPGNHDSLEDPRLVLGPLRNLGIRPLINAHAVLERKGDRLVLFGLADPQGDVDPGPLPGPRPAAAVAGAPAGAPRIGVLHQPLFWPEARKAGAVLTLAAHTHGGQVNLVPGRPTSVLIGKGPYVQGLYRQGAGQLYVTAGLGCTSLPFRLFAPPELAVLTLRRGG